MLILVSVIDNDSTLLITWNYKNLSVSIYSKVDLSIEIT